MLPIEELLRIAGLSRNCFSQKTWLKLTSLASLPPAMKVRMPVIVAEGIAGRFCVTGSSEFGLLQALKRSTVEEYQGRAALSRLALEVLDTNIVRKAVIETINTPTQASISNQKSDQFKSYGSSRPRPVTRTHAINDIRVLRQRNAPRPSFWWILIRTFQRMRIGIITTKYKLVIGVQCRLKCAVLRTSTKISKTIGRTSSRFNNVNRSGALHSTSLMKC